MEIRVFLVDDEQRAIEGLSNVLNTFFDNVSIAGFATDIQTAYNQITVRQPDLVFLDIEMGAESGFQLLEKFEEINFHVVFLTAHEEFALKAIKFSALDYLIKPAEVDDLREVIRKVQSSSKNNQSHLKVKHMIGNFLTQEKGEHKITVAVADGFEFVKVADILYLQADGSYSSFHLKSGKIVTTSKNLKFFESILEGYGFFRIHNSTLINLRYIKRMTKTGGGMVIMEDNQEFGISKSRKDEFMNLLSLR